MNAQGHRESSAWRDKVITIGEYKELFLLRWLLRTIETKVPS